MKNREHFTLDEIHREYDKRNTFFRGVLSYEGLIICAMSVFILSIISMAMSHLFNPLVYAAWGFTLMAASIVIFWFLVYPGKNVIPTVKKFLVKVIDFICKPVL